MRVCKQGAVVGANSMFSEGNVMDQLAFSVFSLNCWLMEKYVGGKFYSLEDNVNLD